MNARSKLLVVGNGMVGQRFLESLPPDSPFAITVLAEEPRPAYDRVQLSAFFSGKTADDLSLESQSPGNPREIIGFPPVLPNASTSRPCCKIRT